MSRPRVVDAHDIARDIVRTFNDREVEYTRNLDCSWPARLQNVGDSLAVAYGSTKWKDRDRSGNRELELYKHVAESRNRAYLKRGLLKHYRIPSESWPVWGPMVSFEDFPMPKHFAVLGTFEEVDLQLYCGPDLRFGRGDDGIVKVTIEDALLGASKIQWDQRDVPFLFVFTDSAKPEILMIVAGDELGIGKDGIYG